MIVGGTSLVGKDKSAALQAGIDRILREEAADVGIGIEVVSITRGEKLYERNSRHLFVPGSSIKLIIGAAALHDLGVDFRFETKIFADGPIEDRVLKGNLYLQGSGDPELVFEDLEELVFQLKLRNIQKIEGDIYVDNTLFDGISQGPGWMWDEGAVHWNSPMDALLLNHSCVDVWVKPSDLLGKAPSVYVHPKTDYVAMKNDAITTAEEDNLIVERRWMQRENTIDVRGQISVNGDPQHFMIPVEAPHLYTGHVFRDILLQANFAFQGEVLEKAVPEEALLLGTHCSRPLSQIVKEMMKTSDNLTGDCLFKKLGEHHFGAPGSWQKGAKAIRQFLSSDIGINVDKLVVMDGSGLSRYNLLSAHHYVDFLKWMYAQFDCSSEFLASLPISGQDGPFSKKVTNPAIKGKVRAKTGTMTGIGSIAGYLTTNDGEVLAFAILQNGYTENRAHSAKIELDICTFLVNFSREEQEE